MSPASELQSTPCSEMRNELSLGHGRSPVSVITGHPTWAGLQRLVRPQIGVCERGSVRARRVDEMQD